MKLKKRVNYTFNSYLQDAWYNNEMVDETNVHAFLNGVTRFPRAIQQTMPAFFILDYTHKMYSLVSEGFKTISNYDPREILEGGLEKFLSIYHKDDFKVFNKNVFTANLQFLELTAQTEHQNYVFSNSYRIHNKDKSISTVLQKSSFITSKETGLPLLAFGSLTDLSHLYPENNYINHFIEKTCLDKNKLEYKTLVVHNRFYIYENDAQLTKQEKNILGYVTEGFSSKMIAEKLKISVNTANNHRQSILKKTNCKNVAQLVIYAIKNKLA